MNINGQGADVVVAGHICLDIIPSFRTEGRDLDDLFLPGKLIDVGPALMAAGGAVGNTGIALLRLGIRTVLIGKIGRDPFGSMVVDLLKANDPALIKGMIIDDSCSTSYTIVISPPDRDRLFFHCPGANDTFRNIDIADGHLSGIRIFHFGYPPLMRGMYRHKGEELKNLFQRVQKMGVITSLDMAKPDPLSEAGHVDWHQILECVLPYVDIFLPGLDEILYMLDRKAFDSLIGEYSEASFMEWIDTKLLDKLADKLINMGTSIIAIKLGNQGLYLRTNANVARLANAVGQGVDFSTWANRQLLAPCFNTNVVGTTGSGDCTIAGVIAGVLSGSNPVTAITTAVGVGACSTETSDATSGVPSLKTVLNRIKSGWQRLDVKIDKQGWKWDEENAVWKGPQDMI